LKKPPSNLERAPTRETELAFVRSNFLHAAADEHAAIRRIVSSRRATRSDAADGRTDFRL
jgi:hypothetical protein